MQLSNLECYMMGIFQFVHPARHCLDSETKGVMMLGTLN
jgi:hypothetical protein